MSSTLIDGVSMAYRTAGSGTPLLLFHGFPFTSEIFWPWLETPLHGARVIAPDLRGFGQSPMRPGPSTMENFATDGLKLLDALGIEQAVVGGVSMGGYVALALARIDPSRVKGLLLLDTQMGADDAAGKQKREDTAKKVESQGLSFLVDDMLPKLLAPETAPATRARVESMMRAQKPAAVAAASRGMGAREDSRDILARFSGPVLVVAGELDPVIPFAKSKAMAEHATGAQLLGVPHAHHLAHLEAAEVVRQKVEAWLQKV